MTALTIEQLKMSFGGRPVLDGVHVEVEAGELVSLLGPSGCGKTTTLNLVAGFLQPDAGRILLAGEDVTGVPPYRRDTAVVFQNYALFPHLRVRDNIAYGLRARRLPAAEVDDRVAETLALLDIAELADRYPGQLSGGQQQRVAVARAVAVRPRVLLMDEPLSNLDAKLRGEIRLELRALQQRLGQAVLFVTHDQEEALSISDRIVVLNAGRVEQVGTPAEVFERPATVFVADFMGVENIYPVTPSGDGIRTPAGLELPAPATGTADHVGIRPSAVRLETGPQPHAPAEASPAATSRAATSSPEVSASDLPSAHGSSTDGSSAPGSPQVSASLARHKARVTGRVYLGDTVRHHLLVEESQTPVVAEQPRTGGAQLDPGDTAIVTFPAADLLPLRAAPRA